MAIENTPRSVDAVQTTCDIIDVLRSRNSAGVTEIADQLDLSKGAVHSHLVTLHRNEYVVKNEGKYELSLRFLDLAEHARTRLGFVDIVGNELEELAKETGEVAQFVVEEHGRAVYLDKALGEDAVQTASRVGTREFLHCIALGKAILASLPRSRVEEIVDRHGLPEQTEHTITDATELYDELEDIRERGYAVDDEEKIKGLRCVAAPVNDSKGSLIGSVSISGPSRRIEGETFRETLPKLVTRAANVIEINAQYS